MISAIIPCHSSHVSKLQNLVSSISEKQTRKPDEIIVVVNPGVTTQVSSVIPVKIIYSDRCTPGKARNLGARFAVGDIYIFFDADDSYHKNRIEFIENCFNSTDADAVVHGFSFRNTDPLLEDIEGNPSFSEAIISMNNNTHMEIPNSDFEIHHGHASFKKSVFEKINYKEDLVPGEDGELLRRICSTGNKVMCILEQLSSWDPSGSWGR